MPYRLGVDLGTTFTAAAASVDGAEPIIIELGNRTPQIPSVLFLRTDGSFLIGEAAERRGVTEPDGLVREFKRRIGDHVPILLRGAPYSPESLMARLLRWVVDTASVRLGATPDEVIVTHPGNWGPFKLEVLDQVVALADIGPTRRCSEPGAAAAQYASHTRVDAGARLVVYDLGGGTFDVCVLEKTARGFDLLGKPDGIEHLGGVDFDEAVFRHVLKSVGYSAHHLDPTEPDTTTLVARLRRDCVDAKEALSSDVEATIPVQLPGVRASVRLTRSEFESMIRPKLEETVEAVRRTLRSATVEPGDLASIVLVGGGSRIPLVTEILQHEFGARTAVDTHPKYDVALGAVYSAQPSAAEEPAPSLTVTSGTTSPSPSAAAPSGGLTDGADPATEAAEGGDLHSGAKQRRTLMLAAALALAVVLALTAVALGRPGGEIPAQPSGVTTSSSPSTRSTTPGARVPLGSGVYTWRTEVAMGVSIGLAERWGVDYEFCEDRSCGSADAADIRLVLDYTVSVPEGFSGSLNSSACPGALQLGSTKESKSLTLVRNSYNRPILGGIPAGSTMSGRVEYSIKKSAQDRDLVLRSSCGAAPGDSEVGVFAGPVPEPRREETPGEVGSRALRREFFTLRVDQVRSNLPDGSFAILAEACQRRNLPDPHGRGPRSLTTWSLATSGGILDPEKNWTELKPTYPYGAYGEGACVSGWLAFEVPRDAGVREIRYRDELGEEATWLIDRSVVVSQSPRPTTSPSIAPKPSRTLPTQRPETRRPIDKPETEEPQRKPPEPETPEPESSELESSEPEPETRRRPSVSDVPP